MYVIGIGGFKRSGKDTFGRLLHEAAAQRGVYAHMSAFAKPVRAAAAAAYRVKPACFILEHKDEIDPRWGITYRQMMINVGEAMRQLDPDHWVKLWRRFITDLPQEALLIVTDVRQRNEARAVKALGGSLVLLQRPGIVWDGTQVELLAHDAATQQSTFDYSVKNDGDVASLRRHADRIVRRVLDKATKKNSSK